MEDRSKVFEEIYDHRKWGDGVNVPLSGPGSSMEYTATLRATLPFLIQKFKIETILDAGCGDMTWMQHVPLPDNVYYHGVDIVESVIEKNKALERPNFSFSVGDIVEDKMERADLVICRDVLFHLSNKSIGNFLSNFLDSDSDYLLTTSHTGILRNEDIADGGFRYLNLRAPPFHLPARELWSVKDYIEGYPVRTLDIWTCEQIENCLFND